jgi:hypothetical protein
MAALTTANVRVVRSWYEGSLTSKRRKVKFVEVNDVTTGGLVNYMPASAFGLTFVEECTTGYCYNLTGGAIYGIVPIADGSRVRLFADFGVAPADVAIPATPNGLYFTVKGY